MNGAADSQLIARTQGKITMSPVAGLSDEEIIRLVAFVRSLDDN